MLILHHYEMSPYSEKIRLMLGYAGLSWQSLLSPEMPPRANIDPLSGGYRRIPIAQIGADIFCDTRLISTEVATLSGVTALAREHCDEHAQAYAAHLEGDIFWAAVLSIPPSTTLKQLFGTLGPWRSLKFLTDRAGVGRNARKRILSRSEAIALMSSHLMELEQRLQAQYLGGSEPAYTDFAAYHTLWFQLAVAKLALPAGLPVVASWYRRMTDFGHGQRQEISSTDAFALAGDSAPRPVPSNYANGPGIGRQVSVCPDDYAHDAVQGRLVGSSSQRWIIARETQDFGVLHVHFPRSGFEIQNLA